MQWKDPHSRISVKLADGSVLEATPAWRSPTSKVRCIATHEEIFQMIATTLDRSEVIVKSENNGAEVIDGWLARIDHYLRVSI